MRRSESPATGTGGRAEEIQVHSETKRMIFGLGLRLLTNVSALTSVSEGSKRWKEMRVPNAVSLLRHKLLFRIVSCWARTLIAVVGLLERWGINHSMD